MYDSGALDRKKDGLTLNKTMAFRFFSLVLVVARIASFTTAQAPTSFAQFQNPFQIPASGFSMKAGQPVTINWIPTTSGTITLVLRSGSDTGLQEGLPIARKSCPARSTTEIHMLRSRTEKVTNSGNYTWTPPTDITRGNDYTLEIINDALPDQTNYSPYFVIDSDNDVATATPTYLYGAPPTGSSGEQHATPTSTVSPTGTLAISQATPVTTVTSGDATGAAIASGISMTSHGSASSTSTGSAAGASTSNAGAAAVSLKRLVALGAGMVILF